MKNERTMIDWLIDRYMSEAQSGVTAAGEWGVNVHTPALFHPQHFKGKLFLCSVCASAKPRAS